MKQYKSTRLEPDIIEKIKVVQDKEIRSFNGALDSILEDYFKSEKGKERLIIK